MNRKFQMKREFSKIRVNLARLSLQGSFSKNIKQTVVINLTRQRML